MSEAVIDVIVGSFRLSFSGASRDRAALGRARARPGPQLRGNLVVLLGSF